MDIKPPVPLGSLISSRLFETLLAHGSRKRYVDGQLIHSRGEREAGLSIIISGSVRFGIYSEGGEYIQTGFMSAGDCFGEATLFAQRNRAYDAESVGQTEILDISKTRFQMLLEKYPELSTALLLTITNRLYYVLDFVDDLRALSVEARVARQILRHQLSASKGSNFISIRQSDLAYSLGLSRVSVGKALDSLKRGGAVSLGYGKIEIVDRELLARWD